MDLRIRITDENAETLQDIIVNQDGSDSAGAEKIADFIRANFTVDYDSVANARELERAPDCWDCDDTGCDSCTGGL